MVAQVTVSMLAFSLMGYASPSKNRKKSRRVIGYLRKTYPGGAWVYRAAGHDWTNSAKNLRAYFEGRMSISAGGCETVYAYLCVDRVDADGWRIERIESSYAYRYDA